ncbi:MAG: hypothetical protein R3F60_05795 [bacterium]
MDLDEVIDVPPPARCEAARHEARLELARPVVVVGHDDDDRFALPTRLWIQGEEVPVEVRAPAGSLRLPGRAPGAGDHPRAGGRGRLRRPHLPTGAPGRPLRARPEPGAGPGPWLAMGTGAAATIAGIVFGGLALGASGELQTYTVRRDEPKSVAELVDERDRWAGAADTAFLVGGTVLVGGLIWYFWETR